MKKQIMACMAFVLILMVACRKDSDKNAAPGSSNEVNMAAPAAKVFYDFIITTSSGCQGYSLTVNDCADGTYKLWSSTTNCGGANQFNGTVAGSGNPLLLTSPATFPVTGATYNIFNNSTTATRDVLSVTFKTGYNSTHKPTISYNPATRKFTVTNAGNTAFVTVSVFSYTGLIAPGVIEFC